MIPSLYGSREPDALATASHRVRTTPASHGVWTNTRASAKLALQMPMTWEYRGDVLLLVSEGLDTPDEWEQALQEAMGDPRFRRGTRLLFDGRRGYSPLASADLERGLEVIAAAVANGASPSVGLLMRDTPRELLDMLQSQRNVIAERTGISFMPFRDEAEALASLQSLD